MGEVRLRKIFAGIPVGCALAGGMTLFVLFFQWEARRELARCHWEKGADPRWGLACVILFTLLVLTRWSYSRFSRRYIAWAYYALQVIFWSIATGHVSLMSLFCNSMPGVSRYDCSIKLEALWLAVATYHDVWGLSPLSEKAIAQKTAGQWRVRVLPYNCLVNPDDPYLHTEHNRLARRQGPASPVCPEQFRCVCEPGPVTASSYFAVLPPSDAELAKYSLEARNNFDSRSTEADSDKSKATPVYRPSYSLVELPGYGEDWRTDGVITFGQLCELLLEKDKSDRAFVKEHIHRPLAVTVSGQVVELTTLDTVEEIYERLFDRHYSRDNLTK